MTAVPLDAAALPSRARALVAHVMFSGGIAAEAVVHNKLRAGLTSLGILFGVASVIAMLAIGNGAEQEILAQMKLLGANNVVVTPIVEQKEGKVEKEDGKKQSKKFSPGLSHLDAQAIKTAIPAVGATSSEVVVNNVITREGHHRSGKVVGVDSSYFQVMNLRLAKGGGFAALHYSRAAPVAVIGQGVKSRFFTTEDPIGHTVKVGNQWLTIVGVLQDRKVSGESAKRLGIRDADMDVYVPLPTMLLRFRNRSEVTQTDMEVASNRDNSADSSQTEEQRTKNIFNIVLGAIASISLVVGGIGIMNIMLASILERIKEIGVRRAMGATQKDVLAQFLTEAVMISLAGGVAGIIVGGLLSFGIERFAKISTIVSSSSVFVAFGVSVAVGLVFGIVPASRAAKQDPIVCLRYE